MGACLLVCLALLSTCTTADASSAAIARKTDSGEVAVFVYSALSYTAMDGPSEWAAYVLAAYSTLISHNQELADMMEIAGWPDIAPAKSVLEATRSGLTQLAFVLPIDTAASMYKLSTLSADILVFPFSGQQVHLSFGDQAAEGRSQIFTYLLFFVLVFLPTPPHHFLCRFVFFVSWSLCFC